MTISLLPLSFGAQPDPIEFLQKTKVNKPKNKAVAQFLREVSKTTEDLEANNLDTSRFLTVYKINFQSVKKISTADVMVGVTGDIDTTEHLVVEKRVDPNISHKLRRKDIIDKIGSELNEVKFTTHTFS